jgi:hypothetical protein
MYKAYKPAPERFRYTVAESIREAEQSAPVKHRFSKGTRIALAVILIAVLLPTAVFGASKLIGLFAEPVDKYGLALNMETTNADYPEYVKMHVDVPEGFIVEPNTDDLKYTEVNADGSYAEGVFSLCPMRPTDSSTVEVIRDVGSYEEITLCGHIAYKVTQMNRTGAYDRLYISYEDVNILLLIYYDNVTEAQLQSFVSGISFTEGTVNDHTELFELFDERIENKMEYTFGYTNIEFDRDAVITFRGFSEKHGDESLRYTAQVTDVRITDTVEGLDSDHFNPMYADEGLTDSTGKLLPRTVTVTKAGDGFNTIDEVQSTEEMGQSLVLIDITYTSLSDEDTVVYIPYDLETFDKKADGTFDYTWNIDPENKITSNELCDSEKLYVSDPVDTVKSLYCTTLHAGEAKTVTIGYRCVTDALDKAYLTIYDAISAGIVDPAPEEYDRCESIPNYIIKVK